MIETVAFMPIRDAKKLTPSSDTALISIHDAGEGAPKLVPSTGWGYYDHIGFDDAAYSIEQIEDHGAEFWDYYDGCARKVHGLRIKLMFKEIHNNPEIRHIKIHCDSGRSRSAAVAKYYAEEHNLELEGDTSYANSLIYRLLLDPSYFDEALEKHVIKNNKANGSNAERPFIPEGWVDRLQYILSFKWVDGILERLFGKPISKD